MLAGSSVVSGTESLHLKRRGSSGISFERDTWTYTYPGTPSEFLDVFRTYYGPTMNAFEAAAAAGREADLQAELETLFNEQNTSLSVDATSIPATFLRVTVTL